MSSGKDRLLPDDLAGTSERYVPALGFRWLTRFYDPLMRVALKEGRFKGLLVERAHVKPGHRVLDIGCGTATLTLMVKRTCPQATVIGVDGDPEILRIGREKIQSAGIDVELTRGMAFDPPFQPASFDRIVSSLVLHHLPTAQKEQTLRRAFELLTPGGEIHIADWGRAQNPLMRLAFLVVQLVDGFETTSDNVHGRLPSFLSAAGFQQAEETHREMTVFGTLSLYRGQKPA